MRNTHFFKSVCSRLFGAVGRLRVGGLVEKLGDLIIRVDLFVSDSDTLSLRTISVEVVIIEVVCNRDFIYL